MNEQMISKAVEAVIREIQSGHDKHGHECKCKKHKMSLQIAKALIEKVELKAKEVGVPVVIAVSDQAGRIVAVHCMDDAYIASYDVAVNKAFTVVALKMSTSTLKPLAQPGQSLYGIQFTNGGRIVIFGGGEPLYGENGKIIGGLGVSGGSEAQDTLLAKQGREFFEKLK